jgi:hypothetical protein
MRIRLFTFSFSLLLMSAAHAQLSVGAVTGGQVSWTKFNNDDLNHSYTIKPVNGFHGGLSLALKVRNRFLLHGSLVYSTKGRIIEGKQDPLLKNKARYNFIEFPITYAVDFRGKIGKAKAFKYYLGIGPNISYWLGGKGELFNSDLSENSAYSEDGLEYKIVFNKDPDQLRPDEMNVADPNRIQLGLNVAAGLVLEPGVNQKFILMIRYELGHSFLSGTSNGTFVPTYYQDVLQSRVKSIRASVSYLIDLRIDDRKKGKSTIRRSKV